MMSTLEANTEEWQKHFTVEENRILYMDDDIVVFPDRRPRASTHLLVVPRHRAIRGVEDLAPSDFLLVQKMARLGAHFANCDTVQMGFHQWPMRSISHLHLHCLVPPFRPAWKKLAYAPPITLVRLTSVLHRLSHS